MNQSFLKSVKSVLWVYTCKRPPSCKTLFQQYSKGSCGPKTVTFGLVRLLLYYHYSTLRIAKCKDQEGSQITGDKWSAVTKSWCIFSVAEGRHNRMLRQTGWLCMWTQRGTRPQPGSHCTSNKWDATLNFSVLCFPKSRFGPHHLPCPLWQTKGLSDHTHPCSSHMDVKLCLPECNT